jgi:aminoglycoside phosphotransferase (APT) family kinase protein
VEECLRPLLDFLASTRTQRDGDWCGWTIRRIGGGFNNLLYRATNDEHNLAVKFTLRDQRDRAGREYGALVALHQAGLSIAPTPLLLDCESYAQPVVVQTWIEGQVADRPPESDTEWHLLLDPFVAAHSVTPAASPMHVMPAVLTAFTPQGAQQLVDKQLSRIPGQAQPASLQGLMRRFITVPAPDWSVAPATLCHVDANTTNFVRRPERWFVLDWENSGWGDPAFEIADLTTHPAYTSVDESRWEWVIETYGKMAAAPAAFERIGYYRRAMAVWWAARLARFLYEIPRGRDHRLVPPPKNWQQDYQNKYEHYLNLANHLLQP